MTDEQATLHVLEVSRRIGAASDRGCIHSVKYIVEGEPGEQHEWLDEFLEQEFDRPVEWAEGADR